MNARFRGSIEASHADNAVPVIDDVVRRAQHGDVEAFEKLYREHSAAMYALCRRMVGDEQRSRELVQDIFVRAWQRLPSFQGHSALGTWLHRLGVNVVLEHLRAAKRELARFIDDDAGEVSLPARASHADLQMDLDRAVAQLPAG